jgi:OmcA/MtrC family decaheme c-type cytochrome
VDFKEMIHKIHTGSSLPSVRQGTDAAPNLYFIVGNRGTVHDYSEVAFPWHDHGVAHCTVCHTGGEDADNWRARPNLAACTSCHDNVKFDGTAGPNCGGTATNAWTNSADCNHSGGPIAPANRADSAACTACHGPGAAFRVDLYHHGD